MTPVRNGQAKLKFDAIGFGDQRGLALRWLQVQELLDHELPK